MQRLLLATVSHAVSRQRPNLSFHGSRPLIPIPRLLHTATIRFKDTTMTDGFLELHDKVIFSCEKIICLSVNIEEYLNRN